LIFDADDELCGDFVLPNPMNANGYKFNFGDANGVSYIRVLMVNNRLKWRYRAVLHEFIECETPGTETQTITGNYYVISGRKGDRSKDPDKYLKDAKVLEAAHAKALEEKDDLYIRYAFYCGNSYFDCRHNEDAIKWYKIVLKQPNWVQEKYIACLRMFEAYDRIQQKEVGIQYLIESRKYDKTRIECIFNLVTHYCSEMPEMSYLYYSLIKGWYETEFLKMTDFSQYLFLAVSVYNYFLAYYMVIVYSKMNKYEEGLVMFEIIFNKKYTDCSDFFTNSLFYNFKLYIPAFLNAKWSNSKKITFVSNLLSYVELIKEKTPNNLKQEHITTIQTFINDFRPVLTSLPTIPVLKKSKKQCVNVFLSITTCKRLDLFKQTINSILNTWKDLNMVDYFFCVDDNSSAKDQEYMQQTYPFFKYYLKSDTEKGHRTSMNIIITI
jgi:hypothetical protein